MVKIGETEVEPAATGVTEPIPWSMETEVAFVVVQESVEEDPVWIAVGLATSVQVGEPGGGGGLTVIGAVQITVPPGPVAVSV